MTEEELELFDLLWKTTNLAEEEKEVKLAARLLKILMLKINFIQEWYEEKAI